MILLIAKNLKVKISRHTKVQFARVGGEPALCVKGADGFHYVIYSSHELEEKVVRDYIDVLNWWVPQCDTPALNILNLFDRGSRLSL